MNILNNITIDDVRLFFSSTCCNKQLKNNIGDHEPQFALPDLPASVQKILEFFLRMDKGNIYAATVTIGTRYHGQMDANGKKTAILKAIRDLKVYYPDCDYYFTFEISKVGALHAHGIIHNLYPAAYGGLFGDLGSFNKDKTCFSLVTDVVKYWEYINKDLGKERINTNKHNITKNKIIKAQTLITI